MLPLPSGLPSRTEDSVELPRVRTRLLVLIAAALVLIGVPAGIYIARSAPVVPPVAFSEFIQHVEAGRVADVTFEERHIAVALKDGSTLTTVAPKDFFAANAGFG